ncbi:protein phosphatase 2C domain-containing protein [Prosthecomicrobium sp. N25]|uniref:protein phosphatase 2C domain-containing protein n=1 Tax=Prosthecomicrobium sp. N25 TaxID=3129254 RepID=UPI0030789774
MRIEAFSRGKHHARPEENEDCLLVLPGLGYAVLDGVTDRSARRYGGMRAGRHASRTVANRLAEVLPASLRDAAGPRERAAGLVAAAGAAIRESYVAHELLAEAEARPALRMGCTLAMAVHDRDRLVLLSVGDTGLRVSLADGRTETHVEEKPLDRITALMRREAWRWAEAQGADVEEVRSLSDAACWSGLAALHDRLPAGEAEGLRRRILEVCGEEIRGVSQREIDRLVDSGIAGQRAFANHPEFDLGYGVLDGFPVPDRYVFTAEHRLDAVETLEIFSDGYFKSPQGFGVEAWEAAFREVEAEDPDKVLTHPSTKGSSATAWADDRTYLGVVLD